LKIRTRLASLWSQKRDVVKFALTFLLLLESCFVAGMGKVQWRLSRSFRPLFLIENFYMTGVRRFLKQFFKSLAPVFDIIVLMMFIIIVYSVLGFYLLGPTSSSSGSPYFQSFWDSLVSLFVLLTTANFPDVMMPSYNDHKAYSAFFFSYLGINLYFLMNLMLTVVYKAFSDVEEKKFSYLITTQVEAANKAFSLLMEKDSEVMEFRAFCGLMREYQPLKGDIDTLLMWRYLKKSSPDTNFMTRSEFMNIYQALGFEWSFISSKKDDDCWYTGSNSFLKGIVYYTALIVKSKVFEYSVYCVVVFNTALLVFQAAIIQKIDSDHVVYTNEIAMVFLVLYILEVKLKLLGLGFRTYMSDPWNVFDLLVTATCLISMVLISSSYNIEEHNSTIVVLRIVRILRLFRAKKGFRDVFGTAMIVFPHLVSSVIALLLLYYVFAIIGMELFSPYELLNCCNGTSIERFYVQHEDPSSILHGYYYLNNFHSLFEAGVTLFELMVVNNWSIIMEAHVIVTGTEWSRLYFIMFYLCTLVAITIVVAAILEAFLFRIQYKKALRKDEEEAGLEVLIGVSSTELLSLQTSILGWCVRACKLSMSSLNADCDEVLLFKGNKRRTREELQIIFLQKRSQESLRRRKACASVIVT